MSDATNGVIHGVDSDLINDAPKDTLMSLLRFNDDDLTENREGRISEIQNYYLRVRRRRTNVFGFLFFIVIVIMATLLIFIGNRNDSSILMIIGIGLTLCNAAIIGMFARFWLRLNADIQGNEVLITSGKLERILKPINKRIINYMIRVDQVEVFVNKETFELLQHEKPYTLYRTPYTGTLLAIEPISE